ncbi:uncharacterized protein LOC118761062 [Octopus sinensis]|uniref:Uncharacterized protein LOC118761062 n=1 Tax=Octopus sinensis TaxID=2607531 RepID=A0A7E6EI05_9MOLL|nr:uncharacterized protein LOC118761062 [Octopus sinensis]
MVGWLFGVEVEVSEECVEDNSMVVLTLEAREATWLHRRRSDRLDVVQTSKRVCQDGPPLIRPSLSNADFRQIAMTPRPGSTVPTKKTPAEGGRRQLIEDSKLLGGDMEHTHLVKGLDYAFLEKVRSEIFHKDESPRTNSSQIVITKLVQILKELREGTRRPRNTGKVESPQKECPPVVETKSGECIFDDCGEYDSTARGVVVAKKSRSYFDRPEEMKEAPVNLFKHLKDPRPVTAHSEQSNYAECYPAYVPFRIADITRLWMSW